MPAIPVGAGRFLGLEQCGHSAHDVEGAVGASETLPRSARLDLGRAVIILRFSKALLPLLQLGVHYEHPKNSYRG